ncbi:MAG TPA: DsbA family protein [Solirubrobacterales bacterium]|nr:DsbA family protein [Solirubrobacterales bacterium]
MSTLDLAEPLGARDHVRGPERGAIEVVEYGDYECPYSRAAYRYVSRRQRSGEPGLRFAFRHFPLAGKHPHAQKAAEAAEAAGAQGRFWPMHDVLFRNQDALAVADLRRYARELGLDRDRFDAELESGAHAERVATDVASGLASGVDGIPVLFFDGRRRFGRGFEGFTAAIDAAERD